MDVKNFGCKYGLRSRDPYLVHMRVTKGFWGNNWVDGNVKRGELLQAKRTLASGLGFVVLRNTLTQDQLARLRYNNPYATTNQKPLRSFLGRLASTLAQDQNNDSEFSLDHALLLPQAEEKYVSTPADPTVRMVMPLSRSRPFLVHKGIRRTQGTLMVGDALLWHDSSSIGPDHVHLQNDQDELLSVMHATLPLQP